MDIVNQKEVESYRSSPEAGSMIGSELLAIRTDKYYASLQDKGCLGYLPYKEMVTAFEFLSGEVTVWAGETKSKKSFFTGFCLMHLALKGQRCALASFEMPPEVSFERMSRAYNAKKETTESSDRLEFGERVAGNLFFYDFVGTAHSKDVYAYIDFCANALKCKHIMIDSLMMIEFNKQMEINNDQKNFMSELIQLAKSYRVHIHLICHFKKPDNIKRRANVYDIMGTSAIPNLASNLFLIERNTDPDINIDIGLTLSRSRSFKEWEGSMGLKFQENFQFHDWKNTYSMSKEDMSRGCYF